MVCRRLAVLCVTLALVAGAFWSAIHTPVAPLTGTMYGAAQCPFPGSCVTSAAGTADGGVFSVTATDVEYGPVRTIRRQLQTTSGVGSGSVTLAVPPNSAGEVTAIISGRRAGDASGIVATSSTWTCGIVNSGGSCVVASACAASSSWTTDAGGSWTATLSVTGCVATVTLGRMLTRIRSTGASLSNTGMRNEDLPVRTRRGTVTRGQ